MLLILNETVNVLSAFFTLIFLSITIITCWFGMTMFLSK